MSTSKARLRPTSNVLGHHANLVYSPVDVPYITTRLRSTKCLQTAPRCRVNIRYHFPDIFQTKIMDDRPLRMPTNARKTPGEGTLSGPIIYGQRRRWVAPKKSCESTAIAVINSPIAPNTEFLVGTGHSTAAAQKYGTGHAQTTGAGSIEGQLGDCGATSPSPS